MHKLVDLVSWFLVLIEYSNVNRSMQINRETEVLKIIDLPSVTWHYTSKNINYFDVFKLYFLLMALTTITSGVFGTK